MKNTIWLSIGMIALIGAFGCSSRTPSTPPANAASQPSPDDEGSASGANEPARDEGSGS